MKISSGSFFGFWGKYKAFIENRTLSNSNSSDNIAHLRDNLFTNFITYLLPICLIALLPGIIMSITGGVLFVAVFDVCIALSIALISLNRKISLIFRKAFVVILLYLLAAFLLVSLGLFGPGTIYLLALCIFVTLLFPNYFSYWPIAINVFICVACGCIIYFKLFNSPLVKEYTIGPWIAVSSNLIVLSWVIIIIASNTIQRLEDAVKREYQLRLELEDVDAEIMLRNELLKESEVHYKSLFGSNPLPMWVMNSESLQFLQVNEAAIREYGYSKEEFKAMTIEDIKLDKDMEKLHQLLQTNSTTGLPVSNITTHRRKSQEQFYVEAILNSFLYKGSEATLVIVRDMTRQINFTQAIEAQNKKLRKIAWIQSHLVRAPLARIMGLVDLISKNKDKAPDLETLSFLDQSAKEFDDIIRSITQHTDQDNYVDGLV